VLIASIADLRILENAVFYEGRQTDGAYCAETEEATPSILTCPQLSKTFAIPIAKGSSS
jgi:hypothetical protein